MIAHSKETKQKTLELLRAKRSYKEISNRTGILPATIEDWAAGWRKEGLLIGYTKPGMEFAQKAKIMSNGYYPILRKRYLSMKWTDKIGHREFGFNDPTEAIHYYLDENGKPRPCTYCGSFPPEGKVWGLDRLNSDLGHIPGNLVPCCSSTEESSFISCQISKSKFTLKNWMKANMSRSMGHEVGEVELNDRIEKIKNFANELRNKNTK